MKRPISVTIIAWFSILITLIAFFSLFFLATQTDLFDHSLSLNPTILLILVLSIAIYLVLFISCIAMLRRKNWGRITYIVLTLILLALSAGYAGFTLKVLIQSIVILGFTYLLLRPEVKQYFELNEVQK